MFRYQKGYAVIENEDLCLGIKKAMHAFEMFPHIKAQPQVFYVGNGCTCVTTSSGNKSIDNCHEMANGTKFCMCNFTRIVGCDFDYVVPVTTRQLLGTDYTLYHDIPKLQIGMNISLFKAMLRHPNIERLVPEINRTAQHMLRQEKRDSENIKSIFSRCRTSWRTSLVGHLCRPFPQSNTSILLFNTSHVKSCWKEWSCYLS